MRAAQVMMVAVCIAVALSTTGAGGVAAVYDIPRLDKVIVDGKLGDWADDGFRVDLLIQPNGVLRSTKSHDARMRLGWNDKGLLVLVLVKDDQWIESEAENELWQNDGVEAFLLRKPGDPNVAQWVVTPGLDATHKALRWFLHDHRKAAELTKQPAELTAVRAKTDGGYVLEMRLPWTALALKPATGLEFGFQLWVNDMDSPGGEFYHAAWYPGLGTCFRPQNAHRCRLATQPSPPESMQATVGYDLDELATRVSVLARGEHVGKPAQLVVGGKVLGQAQFTAKPSGHATADVPLPLPPVGKPYPPVSVQVDGQGLGSVALGTLPEADLSRSVMVTLKGRGRTQWDVKLTPSEGKIRRVAAFSGAWKNSGTTKLLGGGKAVALRATTHWGEATAVVELDGAASGRLAVVANGHGQELDLAKLASETAEIKPGEASGWAEHDVLTISAAPARLAIALGAATAKAGNRREAVAVYLSAAKQFEGTESGAEALIEAAGAYAAHCSIPPLGHDAWDNAIKLYQRVIKDYANTHEAANAKWCIATCTGCWARYGCCGRNQGKQDWTKAIDLYRELYENATDRGSKCDALRRVAEIQSNCLGQWQEGLATYKKILADYAGRVPRSPYWTGRTCGTHNGTWLIDRDLLDFTFPKLIGNTWTADEASQMRDEFLKVAPETRTIEFHALWALANRLRYLGENDRAAAIDEQLGLCDDWLVIGPFDNNQGAMGRTVYGPEQDYLAGTVALGKAYPASLDTGRKGQAMWLNRPSITFGDNWKSSWEGGENSGLYALTYVTSAKAKRAQLRIGSSGPIKAWLNRKLVLDTPGDDFSMVDQFVAPVKLNKGNNELFVKLAVATGFCTNHCRMSDKRGAALRGIAYSALEAPEENEKKSDFVKPRPAPEPKVLEVEPQYGFRVDPMKWADADETLQGALVRTLILEKPKAGDKALIEKEIKGILARQKPDGTIAHPRESDRDATEGQLQRLLDMGYSPKRPEVQKAVAAIEQKIQKLPPKKQNNLGCGTLCVLAALGKTDHPAVKTSFENKARAAVRHPGHGCPWADQIHFMTIWAGRNAADIGPQLDRMAKWMEEAVHPAGCSAKIGLCAVWALVKAVAVVDHPRCRRMAENLVPMLLRAQQPDGGWGDEDQGTFWSFKLLKKYGHLERLRQLPPLPSDWVEVRAIPAPGKEPRAIAWDGKQLWVQDADQESPTATAVSPKDGKVLRTIKLPKLGKCSAIGVWDGHLTLTTSGEGRTLYKIDTTTGEVAHEVSLRFLGDFLGEATQLGDKLLICDHWDSGLSILPAADAKKRIGHVRTHAGTAGTIAVVGDEVWLADGWAPSVVRTNLKGELLDWAEKPYGSMGLAWDGEQLWALDARTKRLCVVQRAEAEQSASLAPGFRYDPMKWVENDQTLEGALVRARVFQKPKPGDKAILEKEIKAILDEQQPDGALSDHELHAVTQTGGRIRRLIELGASPDRPELKRALAYVQKHGCKDKGDKQISVNMARALKLMGAAATADVKDAVKRKLDQSGRWMHTWCGCPWTPSAQIIQLWDVRDLDGRTVGTIVKSLKEIADKLNEAGSADFNDPWSYLNAAGYVDHPIGKQIVKKQIPMILRAQRSDGGWGKHSLKVLRALKKYDLLAELREGTPLSPDFRIVRSIPAPEGELTTMTYGAGSLWVYDKKANEAVALSTRDGQVVKRLKLPIENVRGIGWWDEALAVTQQNPKQKIWKSNAAARMLYQIDPATGKVKEQFPLQRLNNIWSVTQLGKNLVVADGFLNAVGIIDPAAPGRTNHQMLAASGSIHLATEGNAIWHTDWLLTNMVFKSDPSKRPQAKLLDWGTLPFEGGEEGWEKQMACHGLAWDGNQLWALDRARKRICVIEKAGR